MTVRIDPYFGRLGRVTIDKRTTSKVTANEEYSASTVGHSEIRQYVEGDLFLTMCPGVRMVKGFVQIKVTSKSEGRLTEQELADFGAPNSFQQRLDFQGRVTVDNYDHCDLDERLKSFEISVDYDLHLPKSGKKLKLSSVTQYSVQPPIDKTLEPTFTYRATPHFPPGQLKELTEYCHGLTNYIKDVLSQYAAEVHGTVYGPTRTFEWDEKANRPRRIHNPQRPKDMVRGPTYPHLYKPPQLKSPTTVR